MARESPAEKLAAIKQSLDAWESLTPTSRFFGLTFKQFKDAVSPAIQLHDQAEAQRRGLSATIRARDIALSKGRS